MLSVKLIRLIAPGRNALRKKEKKAAQMPKALSLPNIKLIGRDPTEKPWDRTWKQKPYLNNNNLMQLTTCFTQAYFAWEASFLFLGIPNIPALKKRMNLGRAKLWAADSHLDVITISSLEALWLCNNYKKFLFSLVSVCSRPKFYFSFIGTYQQMR